MKGRIILQDIDEPVEGMQVYNTKYEEIGWLKLHRGSNNMYFVVVTENGESATDGSHKSFDAIIAAYPELKQIAVEYEKWIGSNWHGDDKYSDRTEKITLPLHPDHWEVAIAFIGHEVEFKEEISYTNCDKPYCKSIGRIGCSNCAYLDLSSKIRNPNRIDVDKEKEYKVCGSQKTVQAKLALPTPVRTIKDIPEELRDRYPKDFDGGTSPNETILNRVEVIDHYNGKGRAYVFPPADDVKVELSYQDGGKTLKIFLSKKSPNSKTQNG